MARNRQLVIRSIHANRGLQAAYRRQMQALVDEMHTSILYWVEATFKRAEPTLAQDAKQVPSRVMRKHLRELAAQWLKRFDEAAPKIAEAYVKKSFKLTDSNFRNALKDAGLSVKFNFTPAMRDAFDAALTENVGLIKSIPTRYLQQVEGAVMRAYTVGGDLEALVKSIQKIYPVTKNRVELIARDQNNKANAIVTRARQLELGIKKAIWMHSSAGKMPRPDHVAAAGREYDVAKGCLISGEYLYPGQKINCRCTSRSVLPTLGR